MFSHEQDFVRRYPRAVRGAATKRWHNFCGDFRTSASSDYRDQVEGETHPGLIIIINALFTERLPDPGLYYVINYLSLDISYISYCL